MKRKIKFLVCIIFLGITDNIIADIPIVSHRYLADPGSMVYNGRVYIYCSNDDENPPTEDGGYQMKSIVCVSSSDLKNWTDHGIVFQVPRDASWAGKSWAPSAVERDGKFYLYFGNGGSGIGVASADSPTGPFKDPLGQALVSINTPGVLPAENIWLFDPMTFIDDDGQAYMYFGGNGENNLRVIKLNEDMISVSDSAKRFTVPYFFEAAWLHKNNETYYFSYSTNPSNGLRIDYMTSDNPISGFTYGGIVSPQPPDNYNNNHQAIFEFNGTWYEAYHNRYVAMQAGIPPVYRRNICLDSIFHNADSSIQTMVNTTDGVKQVVYVNPFVRVEAETMNAQSGIYTEACNKGGMNVTSIENGDWIKVRGVDFGLDGPGAFTASVARELKYGASKNGSIELRIDDVEGTLIGSVPVSYTGGPDVWKTETIAVDTVTGVHDLYFVFTGDDEVKIFNFDYWYFTEKTGAHDLLAVNAVINNYKIDTIAGYDSSIIKVNAIYSDGSRENVTTGTTFTFNQENIISITDSLIRAINYGMVTITASYNDSVDSVKVIVKNLESELTVAQLNVDNSNIELLSGSTISVQISAEFNDGHIEDVTKKASYDNPNPDIVTISNGVINAVGEGEVNITVSYQGEMGEVKTTIIHVTVSTGSGVWLEAECGAVGSLWNINTDSNASNDEYVTVQTGNNSTDVAPADASGHLTLTFNITAAGTYILYARVICPSPNDDSFWLKMDDGSFAMWNSITGSASWTWTNFPTTYDLTTGSHTLIIGFREDGAKLDKLWITDAGTELNDKGPDASNLCSHTSIHQVNIPDIGIFPNPVLNELNVSLPDSPSDIIIYSSLGREVFILKTNSLKMAINIADYKPGIYFLKITGQEQTVVKKIIKE